MWCMRPLIWCRLWVRQDLAAVVEELVLTSAPQTTCNWTRSSSRLLWAVAAWQAHFASWNKHVVHTLSSFLFGDTVAPPTVALRERHVQLTEQMGVHIIWCRKQHQQCHQAAVHHHRVCAALEVGAPTLKQLQHHQKFSICDEGA
jgi:hypothetical protein